jgi:large subunit ribosomal protein L35Ae
MVNAKVIQFRRGRHTVHERHFLIEIEGSKTRKDAEKFVGKSVQWKSSAGRAINGKIAAPHGTKGVVRAIFEKGLPGQALTTSVEIKDFSHALSAKAHNAKVEIK